MRETVAVALITASSTLLGGGLAALVAARTSSRQLATQERLARQSLDDQRAASRGQRRRDACVSFLGRLDAANRALWEVWTRPLPPDHRTIVDSLYAMVWQLGDASNILLLEGPEEVAVATEDALTCCWECTSDLMRVAAAAAEPDFSRTDCLCALFPGEWDRFVRRTRESHARFLAHASAALGTAMPAVVDRRMVRAPEPWR